MSCNSLGKRQLFEKANISSGRQAASGTRLDAHPLQLVVQGDKGAGSGGIQALDAPAGRGRMASKDA